jgi:hypothetical protein
MGDNTSCPDNIEQEVLTVPYQPQSVPSLSFDT